MIAPEHQTKDDFWNVEAQEKKARASYDKQAEQLERVISTGRATLTLRNQPGFESFIKNLSSLFEGAKNQLVACKETVELPRLQGRAQGLNDVLALLGNTEKTIEGLEAQLKAVQNERDAVLTKDGKVVTNPLPRNDS